VARDITPVVPSPVFAPGVVSHFRVQVTATPSSLDTLMAGTGGIPKLTSGAKPTTVYLAVEDGQTNKVFFTWDQGFSVPAAALGYLVPLQPAAPAQVPCQRGGYPTDLVWLVAPAGNTYIQVKFDWDSSVG